MANRIESYLIAGVAALGLAACADQPTAPAAASLSRAAPDSVRLYAEPHEWSGVKDQYIVRFSEDVSNPRGLAEGLVRQHGGRIHYVYVNVMNGFAATLPAAAVEALRRNPEVARVSPDMPVIPTTVQSSAPWHLDRVDQRPLPLDGQYQYTTTGSGTRIYVVDSGIRYTHADFGGRAVPGTDLVGDGRNGADCFGHGTVVASAAGGATYGVAKQATLVSVRVLDCSGSSMSGTLSRTIGGLDWIAGQTARPAVVNLSISAAVCGPSGCTGTTSQDMDDAVQRVLNTGQAVVVSAGNDNKNACTVSPGRLPGAITVGATTSSDARWVSTSTDGSNFGSCVDVFAPGAAVTTAGHSTDTFTRTENGTSLAAPQVAGAVARFLQQHPTAGIAAISSGLYQSATYDVLSNLGSGSPNVLLLADVTYPISYGYIDGPQMLLSSGTYSWQLTSVSGGTGSFAYTWEADWTNDYQGPIAVGAGNPLSLYLDGCDGMFDLTVRVSSGTARVRSPIHPVENYASCW